MAEYAEGRGQLMAMISAALTLFKCTVWIICAFIEYLCHGMNGVRDWINVIA